MSLGKYELHHLDNIRKVVAKHTNIYYKIEKVIPKFISGGKVTKEDGVVIYKRRHEELNSFWNDFYKIVFGMKSHVA